MKRKNKILKFRKLIYKKLKKRKNKIIENKKVHIKRNKLYNKKNIICSTPTRLWRNIKYNTLLIPIKNKDLISNIKTFDQRSKIGRITLDYITFRIKNKTFQHNLFYSKNEIKQIGIKIKIIEKLYKEFEKEIKKIAKIYNLKTLYMYNPLKSTTKKGILIRMGKGKGKIIENYKILEKNKILLILVPTKEINSEKIYLLSQILNKFHKKYFFLSKFEMKIK